MAKKRKKLNNKDVEKIIELRKKGLTLRDIAKVIGNISKSGVNYHIKKRKFLFEEEKRQERNYNYIVADKKFLTDGTTENIDWSKLY